MLLKKLFAAAAALLLLAACQATPEDAPPASTDIADTAQYHKITAQEASEMMAVQTVTIVDVRTQEEYAAGHIPDAVLVPNEDIGDEPPAALPALDATLLVYCRSGRRSREASEKLLALGYRVVYDFGGILDWPYEIVTENP